MTEYSSQLIQRKIENLLRIGELSEEDPSQDQILDEMYREDMGIPQKRAYNFD